MMKHVGFRSFPFRTAVVITASVPLIAVPLFGFWVHRFLKDYRTLIYAVAFLIGLVLLSSLRPFRGHEGEIRILAAACRSALAGYLAGFIAYVILVLVTPAGIGGLSGAMDRSTQSGFLLLFGLPAVFGGWAYGALVGGAAEWLRGWTASTASR